MLTDSIPKIKNAASCYPNTLCLAAQVLAAVGKLSKVRLAKNLMRTSWSNFNDMWYELNLI